VRDRHGNLRVGVGPAHHHGVTGPADAGSGKPRASLRLIDDGSNGREGGLLVAFSTKCNVTSSFVVAPTAVDADVPADQVALPTIGFC